LHYQRACNCMPFCDEKFPILVLVISTLVNGMGWNGTTGGLQYASCVYVWMVKARDYTGAPYMQQGTVTLIR